MENKLNNFALLILRFGLAVTFFSNGREALEHTAEMVRRVATSGFSPLEPTTLLTLVGIWDITIAILLVLGLWTKQLAIPAALWILVVVLVLSKTDGAEDVLERLPYLATAISLIVLGGGEWGIKRLFSRR